MVLPLYKKYIAKPGEKSVFIRLFNCMAFLLSQSDERFFEKAYTLFGDKSTLYNRWTSTGHPDPCKSNSNPPEGIPLDPAMTAFADAGKRPKAARGKDVGPSAAAGSGPTGCEDWLKNSEIVRTNKIQNDFNYFASEKGGDPIRTYSHDTHECHYQGRTILVENVVPTYKTQEDRENAKKEIEEQLYDVFSKYSFRDS